MSIPDNPFERDRDQTSPSPSPRVGGQASTLAPAPRITPPSGTISPPARTTSPPILQIPAHQPYAPDYNTDSPMLMTGTATSATTPGGSGGGTGLAPPAMGTRTPRRVQWNNDSHIVTISPAPQEPPLSPSNTLDDHNIDQVHAALERHRTRSNRQLRRPQSTLSTASSGISNDDDEDYDYRLDVDPAPPLQPVTSQGSQRFHDDDNALHQILDNGVNDAVPEYINFGETDGLPNVTNIRQDNGQSEAAGLVRAHTGRWGGLRRRVRGAGTVSNAFGRRGSKAQQGQTQAGDSEKDSAARQSRAQDDFASRYPEDDDRLHSRAGANAHGNGAGGPLPGGQGASVLSSLLALYGQQQGLDSGTTSAATSRAGSDEDTDSSDDDNDSPAHGRQSDRRSQEQQRQQQQQDGQNGGFVFRGGRKGSNESSPSGGNTPIRTSASLTQHPSRSAPSIVDRPLSPSTGFVDQMKQSMNKIKEKDRPKAARNGAGVFGALVQNTNNLSGFAAPVNAQLAPAANRPGYQLSRYSASDVNGDTPKVWRPNSRHSSRPGSVHSSTAVSNNGDRESTSSPMKKALSTDDMMSLRERERRERADSAETTVSTTTNGAGSKSVNKFRPKTMTLDSMAKLPVSALKSGGTALMKGGNVVMNAERWVMSGGKTPLRTPDNEKGLPEYFPRPMTEDERRRREWEKEKKRRKKAKAARKKKEVFIIQHVAAVLQRQQFLMKLARALMMFGSPSHRLETQIQATAKVLELNAQVVYLPGTMLISFGDDATHTSETKFLKQATGLDLGKLLATHNLYWNVVHDKISVDDASSDLDILMTTPVYYKWWQTILIGGMCSVFITVVGFNGSFIDALMTMPLGWLLCAVQILSARNDMFSNVFEIAIATIISFIAAALASTRVFCYTALVSGGVVLILPGYIVLTGALELASRNITAGAVRIGYSVIYSLFLGFGISIGAEIYHTITGLTVFGASDYRCESTHNTGMWYQVTPSQYWYFLCCPGFAFFMSLRNQQPLFAKELPVMVFIACAGWVSNFFSARAFPNRSDLTSAIGSFVVGTLGHIYGRFSNGSSFPVTVVGILFQLPSGLSNGGIFSFASENQSGSGNAYSDGFQVAEQLVSVAIGLTVGLFVSAAVTHPFGGGRKRGSGIFSF